MANITVMGEGFGRKVEFVGGGNVAVVIMVLGGAGTKTETEITYSLQKKDGVTGRVVRRLATGEFSTCRLPKIFVTDLLEEMERPPLVRKTLFLAIAIL